MASSMTTNGSRLRNRRVRSIDLGVNECPVRLIRPELPAFNKDSGCAINDDPLDHPHRRWSARVGHRLNHKSFPGWNDKLRLAGLYALMPAPLLNDMGLREYEMLAAINLPSAREQRLKLCLLGWRR